MNITSQNVRLAILFILAIVSFGLVAWAEIVGHPIDATLSTLLGTVLGFIGAQTSAQQVANNTQQTNPTVQVRVVPSEQTTPSPE